MRPAISSFFSVMVTCGCPTTSANTCGRHFRYNTWYNLLTSFPVNELAFCSRGRGSLTLTSENGNPKRRAGSFWTLQNDQPPYEPKPCFSFPKREIKKQGRSCTRIYERTDHLHHTEQLRLMLLGSPPDMVRGALSRRARPPVYPTACISALLFPSN